MGYTTLFRALFTETVDNGSIAIYYPRVATTVSAIHHMHDVDWHVVFERIDMSDILVTNTNQSQV
jgi:hypothetical protein